MSELLYVMNQIANILIKRTLYRCSKCGSDNVDHATRVIGYLKRVSSFSKGRRKEHAMRYYHVHNKS